MNPHNQGRGRLEQRPTCILKDSENLVQYTEWLKLNLWKYQMLVRTLHSEMFKPWCRD